MSDLTNLFTDSTDRGTQRMLSMIMDPQVSQVTCDRYDRIAFRNAAGPQRADRVFASPAQYIQFLNHLMSLTDAGYIDVIKARTSFIEGSFRSDKIPVHGSIHICTPEITRGQPTLVVRKQPIELVTLDQMFDQGMMDEQMRIFLEKAIQGRSNILISGGSGAGKTTLARALSYYIDPWQRVLTAEDIDELHLYDRLQNTVSLTTYRARDEQGRLIRETTLEDLVKEAGLRARFDRIWVGETRGREAFALIKACNSGHDGSVTTIHADSGKQAVKQLVTYVMESGLPEVPAREQVAQAFNVVVQLSKVQMNRRVISEITFMEPVIEGGSNQRLTQLWVYNPATGSHEFKTTGLPEKLVMHWAKHGVNIG